jgi:hypothetical protein
MKKALVGFLILAVGAGVFGQDEAKGLKFGGALKTGFQFQADDTGDTDPSMRMYNDDAGEETRFDLDGSYTQDNYGVVFRLRTDTAISGYVGVEMGDFNPPLPLAMVPIEVNQAYVWADFLNNMINMKVGKIDDSTWKTSGDEGFHYSTGSGLRLEVKPMDGLNLGVFINGPSDNYKSNKEIDGGVVTERYLLETAFGVKYETETFNVAAGLKLDGKGDGLTTYESDYGFETTDVGRPDSKPQEYDFDVENSEKGMGAYVGFGVTPMKGFNANVEARFNNLGGYADYGWIWINETVSYAVTEPIEVGLVMHQRLFGEDAFGTATDANPYLTFKPYVSYALDEKWTVGLDVPLGFWTDVIKYDIGVKPKLSYKVGENASINGFYLFDIMEFDHEGSESTTTHTVQIDFIWTF